MRLLVLLTTVFVLFAANATGQWSSHAPLNPTTRFGQGSQGAPSIVSDGAAGAVIGWTEDVEGLDASVRCQRLSASGHKLWPDSGVVLQQTHWESTGPFLSAPYMIAHDGGVLVAWMENPVNGDGLIRMQRVSADGSLEWRADGVIVATTNGGISNIVSDGAGGAIVSWGAHAQRISAQGELLWTPNGVTISTSSSLVLNPSIISDGLGGAIMTWEDKRLNDSSDIYAQRIDASGVPVWPTGDVAICTRPTHQGYPQLVTDGNGGVIICWRDKLGENMDVYAQRVNVLGKVQWTENGVSICNASGFQDMPKIVSDGVGGAIISWSDKRDDNNIDIYAQRINAGGDVQWTTNGIAVCSESHPQGFTIMTEDGSGGAIVGWLDIYRTAPCALYAQRIDGNGVSQWIEHGVPVAEPETVVGAHNVISNGAGGAIFVWSRATADFSNATHNVYAQNVCGNGSIGDCVTSAVHDPDYDYHNSQIQITSDQDRLLVDLGAEPQDASDPLTLVLVDLLGRPLLHTIISRASSSHSMDISDLPSGIYVVSLQSDRAVRTQTATINR